MNKSKACLITILMFLGLSSIAYSSTIQLYSGQDGGGDNDANVTRLEGPANGPFTQAFDSDDFDDARNGDPARLVNRSAGWVTETQFANAGGNANAAWIAASKPKRNAPSALFAHDFNIADLTNVNQALLSFYWAASDEIGDPINEGVFINGTPIIGSKGGSPNPVSSIINIDILPLLTTLGPNTLYVNLQDGSSQSGIIFSADIELKRPAGVPIPAPFYLMITGLTALIVKRRKRT